MKYRRDRINESVAHELNDIIRGVKDPRVSDNFVTVNAADVTGDLKIAKIYFGCITGDPAEVKTGLKSAAGYLRRELAIRLNLRNTPELVFLHDSSAENGARISGILKELDVDPVKTDD